MILIIFSYYYFLSFLSPSCHSVWAMRKFRPRIITIITNYRLLITIISSLDAELSEQRLLLPNLSDYRLLKPVTSEGTGNFKIITSALIWLPLLASDDNCRCFGGDKRRCLAKIFNKSRHIIMNVGRRLQERFADPLLLGSQINSNLESKLSVWLYRFSFWNRRFRNFWDIWIPNFRISEIRLHTKKKCPKNVV